MTCGAHASPPEARLSVLLAADRAAPVDIIVFSAFGMEYRRTGQRFLTAVMEDICWTVTSSSARSSSRKDAPLKREYDRFICAVTWMSVLLRLP